MSEINLIPTEFKNKHLVKFSNKKTTAFILISLFLIFIIFLIYENNSLNNKLKDLKEENLSMANLIESKKNEQKKLKKINEDIISIENINRTTWGEKLLQVNSKIVEGAFLSQLETNNNELVLKGYSDEFINVGIIVNGIKDLKFIKTVELSSAVMTDSYNEKYYAFNILCKVK